MVSSDQPLLWIGGLDWWFEAKLHGEIPNLTCQPPSQARPVSAIFFGELRRARHGEGPLRLICKGHIFLRAPVTSTVGNLRRGNYLCHV